MSIVRSKVGLEDMLGQLLAWHSGSTPTEEFQQVVETYLRENTVVATHEQLQKAATTEEFAEVASQILEDHLALLAREQAAERLRLQQEFNISQNQKRASLEIEFLPSPPRNAGKESSGRPWLDPMMFYDRMDHLVQRLSLGIFTIQSLVIFCSIGAVVALILVSENGWWSRNAATPNSATGNANSANATSESGQTPDAGDADQEPSSSSEESGEEDPEAAGAEEAAAEEPTEENSGERETASNDEGGAEDTVASDGTPEEKPSKLLGFQPTGKERPKFPFRKKDQGEEGTEENDEQSGELAPGEIASSEEGSSGSRLMTYAQKKDPVDLNSVLADVLGVSPEEVESNQGRRSDDVGLQEILRLLDEGSMDEALDALTRKSAAFSEDYLRLIKIEILSQGDPKDRQECWETILRLSNSELVSDMVAARLLLSATSSERSQLYQKFKEIPGAPERFGNWILSWARDSSIVTSLERQQRTSANQASHFLDGIFLANGYYLRKDKGDATLSYESLNKSKVILENLKSEDGSAVYSALVARNREQVLEIVNKTMSVMASKKVD